MSKHASRRIATLLVIAVALLICATRALARCARSRWTALTATIKSPAEKNVSHLAIAIAIGLPALLVFGTVFRDGGLSASRAMVDQPRHEDYVAFTQRLLTAPPDRDTTGRSGHAVQVAPYLFLGGSQIPDARTIMARTGVTTFTLAFVLSDGGCDPAWGGNRPLTGSVTGTVTDIQSAGGEVVVSFGGWSGHKLGRRCPAPRALAAAYQRVIDAYRLRAIDVDIEYHEFEDRRAQDRVLRALKIVEATNPGLTTIVTMPVTKGGLNTWGERMVRRAAQLRVPVDTWTIMPFVLGRPGADMGRLTIRSAEHTHRQLARHQPGASAAEIYRTLGISTMNGDTGAGETITQADFREIRRYAHRHGLGRLTFWAINRDRSCLAKGHRPCSGVPQRDWEFTKIINGHLRP